MPRTIFILSLLCSCTQKPAPPVFPDLDHWYGKTRSFILSESTLPTDSTSIDRYDNGKKDYVLFYRNGHLAIKKKYRETGEQVVQIDYSRDGQFELRKEICEDGKLGFEGIFYKGEAYGLSSWWRCGKSKESEGVRYKGQKIGVWKNWDKSGKVTETDFKNANLIDSLQWIRRSGN